MPLNLGGKTVQIDGLGKVRALLREAEAKSQNLAPVLGGPISSHIHQLFRRQFESEGEHFGTRWAPLRPLTQKLRARHHRSDMPKLRFSNTLWASLVKRGGEHSVRDVGPLHLIQGTSDKTAKWHQEGWTQRSIFGRDLERPRNVPARPLLPDRMPRSTVNAWATLIARHVEP